MIPLVMTKEAVEKTLERLMSLLNKETTSKEARINCELKIAQLKEEYKYLL